MERLQFIATIKPVCLEVQKTSGIPWQWFVAQAIQESGGYGLSDLAVKAHNLFGIKGDEYYQGQTGYAKFDTWNTAVRFQGWQLNVPRYAKYKALVQAGKFKEYGDGLQEAKYCAPARAGEQTYGTMIEAIAKMYGLIPEPVVKLNVAMQWAVDNGYINDPTNRQVDLNTLAWFGYKLTHKESV